MSSFIFVLLKTNKIVRYRYRCIGVLSRCCLSRICFEIRIRDAIVRQEVFSNSFEVYLLCTGLYWSLYMILYGDWCAGLCIQVGTCFSFMARCSTSQVLEHPAALCT